MNFANIFVMNTIYPCFWFDNKAKDAADFYCRVFPGASIFSTSPIVTLFQIGEERIMCLNGAPAFKINPAISLFYVSESKQETDKVWNELAAEGSVMMKYQSYPWSEKYGWLQDKYGISWQISYGKRSDVGQAITPSFLFTGEQQGKAEGKSRRSDPIIHFHFPGFQNHWYYALSGRRGGHSRYC